MVKKSILILLLALIVVSGVFAQGVKNFASGEIGLFGAGARYEYMLSPKMSIGANAYWNSFFFVLWNDWAVDFSFRHYISKILYIGVAVGFHQQYHSWRWRYSYDYYDSRAVFGNVIGFAITPEIGWKIDFDSPGGFFVSPGMKLPIALGAASSGFWYDYGYGSRRFGWGITLIGYVGLGYAW